jgi:hypothetical protein
MQRSVDAMIEGMIRMEGSDWMGETNEEMERKPGRARTRTGRREGGRLVCWMEMVQ